MRKQANLPMLLQKYFLQWLMTQRNVSPQTIKSYRDTFRLYLRYMESHYGLSPEKVSISEFDSDHILEFLTYLEKDRKNNPKTINSRLAAIHSFIKFLTFELPEYSGTLSKSLMVPFRKIERCQMEFLTESEFSASVNACEVKTALGNRDRLMLLLLYNTGIRVSELVGLKVSDVIMDSPNAGAYIRIYGKGRKIRQLPLWKTTTKYISNYVSGLKINSDESLFTNQMDSALTRSGVRYRLNCLQERASETSPSLAKKKITPHTFRHTAALRMLQSGVDISTIAIWMGHESILTTHKYMEADMEMKRQTLEKMSEPGRNSYHFVPKSSTLKFLDSL